MTSSNRFESVMSAARGQLPALFVFSFLANLLLLASSVYMLQVFDRVLSSGSIDTLIWLTVIAITAICAYGLLEHARRRLLIRIGGWVESELAPSVVRRAIGAKLSHGRSTASLSDVSDVRGFIGGDAVLAFLDAPWTPVFIALIWLIHPILGVIAAFGAVVLFFIALVNDWLTRKKQAETSAKLRGAQIAATRYVDSAETVSALGMTGALIARWMDRQKEARAEHIDLSDTNAGLFNLSRSIRLALQIAVLGSGAALVLQAELTPGGMIAASIIMSRALSPVERSITAWRSFIAFRSGRARLSDLFSDTKGEAETLDLPRPNGLVEADSVRFVPPGATEPILKKVDFKIAPGEVCGVIGPSGSGKSTLSRLLVGTWRPSFGSIRLDSADVAVWDPEKLGPFIGYLPQEVELFPGTVAENIARMKQAEDSEVIEAAQLAGAHQMILHLPNGYDTQVGAHGDQLSGGQRQRIALARALFRDPALIVLDEPNSNLDGDGELALLRGLSELKKRGRTMFIVAHQPSLLRIADKVLVLREGVGTQFGPRDEVLQSLMKSAKQQSAARPAKGVEQLNLKTKPAPAE